MSSKVKKELPKKNSVTFGQEDRDNIGQILDRQKTIERVLSNQVKAPSTLGVSRNDQLGGNHIKTIRLPIADEPPLRVLITNSLTNEVMHDLEVLSFFGVGVFKNREDEESMAVIGVGPKAKLVKAIVESKGEGDEMLNRIMN